MTADSLAAVFADSLVSASAAEIDEALFDALDAAEAEYAFETMRVSHVSRDMRTAKTVA